jgi:hypothetical protein
MGLKQSSRFYLTMKGSLYPTAVSSVLAFNAKKIRR